MSAAPISSRNHHLLRIHNLIPTQWKTTPCPFPYPCSFPPPQQSSSSPASDNQPAANPQLPPPTAVNVVSLASSVRLLAESNNLSAAFDRLSHLRRHGSCCAFYLLHPLFSLVVSCTNTRAFDQGRQLHAHLLAAGVDQDPLLVPKLVNFYLAFGLLSDAHFVVGNLVSSTALPWNLVISAHVKDGLTREALLIYKEMVAKGVAPDSFTYPSVLRACGDELDLELGVGVHRSVDGSGLPCSLFVQNALIGMYAKCGVVREARKVFDRMHLKDVVSWNSIISAYASKGMWEEAFELFEGIRLHCSRENSVTWNTIAGGNLQIGNYAVALKLISQMNSGGVHLDSVAVTIGLAACSRLKLVKTGKALHCLAIGNRFGCVEGVRNALITMYSRCERLDDAYMLFQLDTMKGLVTWNCMISGFSNLDLYEEASTVFREMVATGTRPNYVTVASILPLCARIANLQHGKELHGYVVKHNFQEYLLIWNALVDMYAKSSRMFEAERVFKSMTQRDKVTYTSLIAGYGMQGGAQKALGLFEEMQRCEIIPDHITMVSVLAACSHSGLVVQGQNAFDKMTDLYGIIPRMEHYACMVDLYGRAGWIRKAKEVLLKMPFQPSAAMWATLTGACRIHRNIEIGGWAAEQLLRMKPQKPGYYVLIANMYAAAGKWDKLAEVRTLMRDNGLKKTPGCAWIGVDDGFHPFLVGDISNPQTKEIYVLLEELEKHMKDAGYVADVGVGLEEEDYGIT